MTRAERAEWRRLEAETLADITYWQTAHRVAHLRACHDMRHGDIHAARLAQRYQSCAHVTATACLRHLADIRAILAE